MESGRCYLARNERKVVLRGYDLDENDSILCISMSSPSPAPVARRRPPSPTVGRCLVRFVRTG
jgi:hypothetical protein